MDTIRSRRAHRHSARSAAEIPHVDAVASPDDGPAPRVVVICPDSAADAAYFAAALSRHLHRLALDQAAQARDVVLLDSQPGCGGLDVLLDLDATPGARWGALKGAGADVDGRRLLEALPTRDGVRVLSHSRDMVRISPELHEATVRSLVGEAAWIVEVCPPHDLETAVAGDVLVLVVRGTVTSMAAAQQVMAAVDGALPCVVIALEASLETRDIMATELDAQVVGSAPRWRMGLGCAKDVLEGRWPGENDSSMTKLVQETAAAVRTPRRWAA